MSVFIIEKHLEQEGSPVELMFCSHALLCHNICLHHWVGPEEARQCCQLQTGPETRSDHRHVCCWSGELAGCWHQLGCGHHLGPHIKARVRRLGSAAAGELVMAVQGNNEVNESEHSVSCLMAIHLHIMGASLHQPCHTHGRVHAHDAEHSHSDGAQGEHQCQGCLQDYQCEEISEQYNFLEQYKNELPGIFNSSGHFIFICFYSTHFRDVSVKTVPVFWLKVISPSQCLKIKIQQSTLQWRQHHQCSEHRQSKGRATITR